MWGSPREDIKGRMLAEWAFSLGLSVLNSGQQPTFERDESRSYIDVSFAKEEIARRVQNWQVLDEETLSLHKYIKYQLGIKTGAHSKGKWKREKLDCQKFTDLIQREPVVTGHQDNVEQFMNALERICKAATPHIRTDGNGNEPYWWTSEMAEKRRGTLELRRNLTRARTRARATALSEGGMIRKSEETLAAIKRWMTDHTLTLAKEKIEAVVIAGMRRTGRIRFKMGVDEIEPKKEVKYLGVVIDRHLNFGSHTQMVCGKAEKLLRHEEG